MLSSVQLSPGSALTKHSKRRAETGVYGGAEYNHRESRISITRNSWMKISCALGVLDAGYKPSRNVLVHG